MNLSDEIEKLQQLHASGALNDAEFAQAKAAVLAQASSSAPVETQLRGLEIEAELARLDREWEMERENYMVNGKYGSRHVPTAAGGILIGVSFAGFGLIWTIATASTASSFGGFGSFPLFGVLFTVIGVVLSMSTYSKANQYDAAFRRYEERRAQLIAEQNASE